MQIIGLCDLDDQKASRKTCRALYLAASILPLGQVYLAARAKTLSAALSICKDDDYRKQATGLTIDVIVYVEDAHREPNLLQAMYLVKKELRKPGFRQWTPYLAKKDRLECMKAATAYIYIIGIDFIDCNKFDFTWGRRRKPSMMNLYTEDHVQILCGASINRNRLYYKMVGVSSRALQDG